MLKNERQRQIMELLNARGKIEISELCHLFDVTNMTIRRDLDDLENAGLLIRSRGGALLTDTNILIEHPFNLRLGENAEQKKQIAKAACDTVLDGRKIYMGSGSTLLYMSRYLNNSKRIIVVTDAINVAAELLTKPSVSVIMVGGDVRPNTYSAVGTFAENMVKQFKCQVAYIGVTGIGKDGTLYVASVSEAGLFRSVFENSSYVYVLADSTKLGCEDFVSIGRLGNNFTLITDSNADKEILNIYRSIGTDIIIA